MVKRVDLSVSVGGALATKSNTTETVAVPPEIKTGSKLGRDVGSKAGRWMELDVTSTEGRMLGW